MSLSKEQRLHVYRALDSEWNKAATAAAKAVRAYDEAQAGTVERETAAVILSLRQAQRQAAADALNAYFNDYLKD